MNYGKQFVQQLQLNNGNLPPQSAHNEARFLSNNLQNESGIVPSSKFECTCIVSFAKYVVNDSDK